LRDKLSFYKEVEGAKLLSLNYFMLLNTTMTQDKLSYMTLNTTITYGDLSK